MPIHPDSPLKKITLNLYEADVAEMEHRYGRGWSEQVRRLVNQHLKNKETAESFLRKQGYDLDH
jgi:hypothetical protein